MTSQSNEQLTSDLSAATLNSKTLEAQSRSIFSLDVYGYGAPVAC